MSDITTYINRIVRDYSPVQMRADEDGRICVAINGFELPRSEGGVGECVGYGSTVEDALSEAAVDVDD